MLVGAELESVAAAVEPPVPVNDIPDVRMFSVDESVADVVAALGLVRIPPVVESPAFSAGALVDASEVVGRTIIEGRSPVDPRILTSDGLESRIVDVGAELGCTVSVD